MAFRDHFSGSNGSAPDATYWSTSAGASSSVTVNGDSELVCSVGANNEQAFAYHQLDLSNDQIIRLTMQWPTGSQPTWWILLYDSSGAPAAHGAGTGDYVARIAHASGANGTGPQFTYWTSAGGGARQDWHGGNKAWEAVTKVVTANFLRDDYHEFIIQIEGTGTNRFCTGGGFRIGMVHEGISGTTYGHDQGARLYHWTTWVNWSSTIDFANTPYLVLGNMFNDMAWTGDIVFEYAEVDDRTWRDMTVDARDSGADSWVVQRLVGPPGLMLPLGDSSGPTVFIPLGSGGSWDDAATRHASLFTDGTTYYSYYIGSDGTNTQLGAASGSSLDSALTKSASNPLITVTASTNRENLGAAKGIYHSNATAGEEFKLLYAGLDASSVFRIFYAYGSAYDSLTEYNDGSGADDSFLLGPGGVGDHDELGYAAACLRWDATRHRWEVWAEARDGDGESSLCRFYGADITALTEDAANPYFRMRTGTQPATTTTAALNESRSISLTSESGFVQDMAFSIDWDSTDDNGIIGRWRGGTAPKAYHKMTGASSGAYVRGVTAWQRCTPTGVEVDGSTLRIYGTIFGPHDGTNGDASTSHYLEMTCMWEGTASSPTDLALVYAYTPFAYPTALDRRSYENPALLMQPVTTTTPAPPPAAGAHQNYMHLLVR